MSDKHTLMLNVDLQTYLLQYTPEVIVCFCVLGQAGDPLVVRSEL